MSAGRAYRSAALLIVVLCAAWAIGADAAAEVAARGRLLGTGVGAHAWWIDVRSDGAYVLHASSASGAAMRVELAHYDETPDGIAAWGDRVWLTFPPTADRPERRDVITFTTRESAATGLAYAEPRGGADLVASLPTDGELAGFAADARGPYALLQAAPGPRFGVRREGASQAAADAHARLLRLEGNEWKPVALPAELASASSLSLARYGDAIAVVAPQSDGHTSVAVREGESWTLASVAAALGGAAWLDAAGRAAVAVVDGPELRVSYLRDFRLVAWARLGVPSAAWFIVGDDHGASLISGAAGTYQRRRLGPIDAQAGPIEVLAPPGFRSGAWIHVPILGAIAIAGIMAVVFMRSLPGRGGEPVEAGPPPLSLERRAMALVVDFLPGAVVAVAALSASPSELLSLPSWSLDLAAAEPSLVAIVVTCVHGAVGEYFVGRSFGKALVGGVVLSADGSPVTARQVLVRTFFKFITLCAPILGCFVFFSQANRSLGDVLANAIVADGHDPEERANG